MLVSLIIYNYYKSIVKYSFFINSLESILSFPFNFKHKEIIEFSCESSLTYK